MKHAHDYFERRTVEPSRVDARHVWVDGDQVDAALAALDEARRIAEQYRDFYDPVKAYFPAFPWESPIAGVVSDAIGGSTGNAANVKPEGRVPE